MSRTQKILGGIAAGLLAASAVVPVTTIVTVPVVGAITLGKALFALSAFFTGWAKDHHSNAPADPAANP